MFRKSISKLCQNAARSNDGARQRALGVFAIRKAPTSLYEDSMHSNTLTDHPITHRTSKDELAYRQRKLTERGQYEEAAIAEEEAEKRDKEGKAGSETTEYYCVIAFTVLGYLAAHATVFNYYYSEDIKPYYALDRGYTNEVEARRYSLEALDELVGVSVLNSVYSKRKAQIKQNLFS